nr:MAG TPA: hypothetical protein [Caudoviricetes sp.]
MLNRKKNSFDILRQSGGRGTLRLEEALKPDLHIPDCLFICNL